MKRSATILQRLSRFAFVGLLGLTVLSSCKKDDEYDVGETAAKVNLINASPDAGAARLYVDGVLRTPNDVTLGNSSGYYGTFVGNQNVEIKTASGQSTLTSTSAQLDAFGYYSFILFGSNTAPGVITVTDAGVAPVAGKARIRFVNTVSNSSAMSLRSGSETVVSGLNFRGISNPVEVTAGNYTFTGISGTSATNGLDVKLESGKVYVIYARGTVLGSQNNAFALGAAGN